jgi:hypothetical protein
MKKILLFLTVLSAFQFGFAQQEISGVTPAKTIKIGNENLTFNGAGIREKFFLDLYVGSLYLTNASNDRKEVMNNDETMAITLDIVSSLITSQKMIDAVNEGFENSTKGNTTPLKDKIETFKSFFKEEIKKGDHFVIAYQKGLGVVVSKNGKKMSPIEGYEFKKALFGIWFCDEPADEDLMEGMLGED